MKPYIVTHWLASLNLKLNHQNQMFEDRGRHAPEQDLLLEHQGLPVRRDGQRAHHKAQRAGLLARARLRVHGGHGLPRPDVRAKDQGGLARGGRGARGAAQVQVSGHVQAVPGLPEGQPEHAADGGEHVQGRLRECQHADVPVEFVQVRDG